MCETAARPLLWQIVYGVFYSIFYITGLDRPLELQEVQAPRISRQSAHM